MEELKWFSCKKLWYKLEKEFTTDWANRLKKKWFFWFKISDMDIRLKPLDWLIATPFWDYYCEIKIIKSDEFSFSMFQPNQIKALEHLTKLWRNAIVVIYSKQVNSYLVYKYEDLKFYN